MEESCGTDPVLVFAAVKKMAPLPLEAIGPQVPNECFFQRGVGFSQGESHAGVCTWVRACRGVGAGVTMSVWA